MPIQYKRDFKNILSSMIWLIVRVELLRIVTGSRQAFDQTQSAICSDFIYKNLLNNTDTCPLNVPLPSYNGALVAPV